jgi:XTP/dITP diphosphohydrolase
VNTVVVATGNPGKLQELQVYLQGLDWELALKPDELDIDETGETFLANARLKAKGVALATQQWSIADDSGLVVDALKGAPGIYSARYGATDEERIHRVLRELGTETHRQAQFVCAIVLAKPDGTIALEAEGICPGEILYHPKGNAGFGYDPIFYVPEVGLTFAEMSAIQKHELSHRGRAFALLQPSLQQLKLDR